MNHTEGSIIQLLNSRYTSNIKYKLANAFIFKSDWETDFFVLQNASGYSYEIEIKVSRSDFFSDKNKVAKHQILKTATYENWKTIYPKGENGKYLNDENGRWKTERISETINHDFRPNKFYYCVPEGMITVADVPPYAGLMYAGEYHITTIKEAPFIHKEKLKFKNILCDKFYYYWVDQKNENRRLIDKVAFLESENNKLTA